MNQEQARARIEELKAYYAHIAAFVSVNLFLMMINFVNYSEDGEIWFFYPLAGWGIGLLVHTVSLFAGGNNWEARKMQELTGWSITQEELERLSERTETLISILSNVNWEKIDPDLAYTQQNLLNARQKIVNLKSECISSQSQNSSSREVIKEIEKLEKFVTSNKFSYYDQASNDINKG